MGLVPRIAVALSVLGTLLCLDYVAFGGLWKAPAITVIVVVGVVGAFLKVVLPDWFRRR